MASSGTTVFEKTFFIDDIIEESFERIGLINNTGNQMKAARRSLNIMFQEWSNRGLHYWEVAQNSISMVEGQSVYTIYRSSGDGTSDATFSLLNGAISAAATTITLDSVYQFPTSGTLLIDSEQITYTGTDTASDTITGCTRGANSTVAATHTDNTSVYDYTSITYGADDILEASYRNTEQDPVVDFPLTKISRSGYSALSSKFSEGTPTQYYVQRLIDKITITLYLTPGSSEVNNVMFYYYAKRIQDVGAYTNITDVPYRFVPCMCAGLSYYLAQKYSPQRVQEMRLLYEDELKRALEQDGSPSSSFITPKIYYPSV
tara:strand:+ start:23 stop:976 length:954 start_codon:yes stop_codon:yes gene_type:complete